jgi:hypothetical protein
VAAPLLGANISTGNGITAPWPPLCNFILGLLSLIQVVVKIWSLEDMKNDCKKTIRVTDDLIARLESCAAKMQDYISDGALDDLELTTWEKIVTFIAHVDAIALSIDLGQEIRNTGATEIGKDLQKVGIIGLPGT